MQIELPGQLKGPECRRVIIQAIALRRQLEPWFDDLSCSSAEKLAIVLRVDGSLGSFGQSGVENIEANCRIIKCDLVIEDLGWDDLSDVKIYEMLADRVINAAVKCLRQTGIALPVADLHAVAVKRGY